MKNSTIARLMATCLIALFAYGAGLADASAEKPKYVIKIASLAPKGSTWAKSFDKTNRDIQKATNGEVAFKIYPGGVMGDEGAMVRKMRTGQLDGGAVTSVGMGDIEPQILALQLPLMFKNYGELDYVRNKMSPTFKKLLNDKGFVLLHWGDVGFNYIFSNTPVSRVADIKKTKMWVWDADPISKTVMSVAGVNGTLLGVPDVLPSLQTGVIDAYANSPYGAVALQWHTKAKYVTNIKLAMTIGGLIISKSSWEKLPTEHRETILKIAQANGKKLLKDIRKDNKRAIKTIKNLDIQMVKPEAIGEWLELAKATRNKLQGSKKGSLFPKSLVNEMLGHLKDYRKK